VSKPLTDAWHFVDRNHYKTRGASVKHDSLGGWHAIVGRKIRGPLSSLDAAMAAADKMLAESAKVAA